MKGKAVEVCLAYRKNPDSFDPEEPMRCDRPVNPEIENCGKPKWERLDALKDFDSILKVDRLLRRRHYSNMEKLGQACNNE